MDARNEQIEALKRAGGIKSEEDARKFFGLPFGDGQQDMTFEQTLEAIVSTTDNLIYFAYQLSKDLQKHGHLLAEKYRKRLGGSGPHITRVDFSERVADGTIPHEQLHAEYMARFLEPKLPPSRWQRIRHPIASHRQLKRIKAERQKFDS
jgi:hypothetical protein